VVSDAVYAAFGALEDYLYASSLVAAQGKPDISVALTRRSTNSVQFFLD